jgi:hypothetical protein
MMILPRNLEEKIEYVISEFILELHNLGIIEIAQQNFTHLQFHNAYPHFDIQEERYENEMYLLLFNPQNNNLYDYNGNIIFERIENLHFDEDEQRELRRIWNFYNSNVEPFSVYALASIVASQDITFIMEHIETVPGHITCK